MKRRSTRTRGVLIGIVYDLVAAGILSACATRSGPAVVYVGNRDAEGYILQIAELSRAWAIPPEAGGTFGADLPSGRALLVVYDQRCDEVARYGIGSGTYVIEIAGRETDFRTARFVEAGPGLVEARTCPRT